MIVQIQSGTLKGEERDGIRVFLGIPYAAPQVETSSHHLVGNEDCLVVNVYTPVADGPHPVLVWIHGGGAVTGSPNGYDGTLFAQHGVVVVTVGYRLGVLGLLYLPGVFNEDADGNFSLLDQVAALRWVQENIAAFGGDPVRVTVAGESNGGRTVGTLLATPSARGLFHQAIVQSGTGVGYVVASPEEARKTTEAVLAELGLDSSRAKQVRETPVERLLEAQSKVSAASPISVPYQVVVDGKTLLQRPIDAITKGSATPVRLLVGTNHDEADLFMRAAAGVEVPGSMVVSTRQLAQARSAYRQLLPADWSDDEVIRYTMTSSEWWIPAVRLAEAQTRVGGQAWMYRLDWRIAPRGQGMGAPHSLDLPLLFGPTNVPGIGQGIQRMVGHLDEARVSAISATMHAAWVRFITTGEPGWQAYDLINRTTFLLNDRSALVQDPDRALRLIWNDFI
jgi:para-nitrobenzyl esterase